MRASALALGASLLAVGLGACGGEEAPSAPLRERSEQMDLARIPEGAVHGEIGGRRFRAADVRFRVQRRRGRERVDLLFAERSLHRCGLPLDRQGSAVWLRFDGVTALEPGESRVDPGGSSEAPFSLHYQIRGPEGWRGVGVGAAKVAIESVERRGIRGRMRACFDDGRGSCVEGRFLARECRGEVAGFALREGPTIEEPAEEAGD